LPGNTCQQQRIPPAEKPCRADLGLRPQAPQHHNKWLLALYWGWLVSSPTMTVTFCNRAARPFGGATALLLAFALTGQAVCFGSRSRNSTCGPAVLLRRLILPLVTRAELSRDFLGCVLGRRVRGAGPVRAYYGNTFSTGKNIDRHRSPWQGF